MVRRIVLLLVVLLTCAWTPIDAEGTPAPIPPATPMAISTTTPVSLQVTSAPLSDCDPCGDNYTPEHYWYGRYVVPEGWVCELKCVKPNLQIQTTGRFGHSTGNSGPVCWLTVYYPYTAPEVYKFQDNQRTYLPMYSPTGELPTK